MYKKQVKLQRIFCLLALITSALVFAYSLGLVTDLYDMFYYTMRATDHTNTSVPGSIIYYDIQPFNHQLTIVGLVLIILSLGLFLTNTQVRRRYYIGNYVATGIWSVAAVAATIWAHIQVEAFKHQFLTEVDFVALKEYADANKTLYTKSTLWFDLHYLAFGLLLLTAIALVCNVFWKNNLMKQEAALLAGSASKAQSGAAAKAQ